MEQLGITFPVSPKLCKTLNGVSKTRWFRVGAIIISSRYNYRWSLTQVTQRISYQEQVISRQTMFERFSAMATERSSLSQVHRILLQQSWELWQPAFVLERDSTTFWLSHPQRCDRLAKDSVCCCWFFSSLRASKSLAWFVTANTRRWNVITVQQPKALLILGYSLEACL